MFASYMHVFMDPGVGESYLITLVIVPSTLAFHFPRTLSLDPVVSEEFQRQYSRASLVNTATTTFVRFICPSYGRRCPNRSHSSNIPYLLSEYRQ